jgi:putative transposase
LTTKIHLAALSENVASAALLSPGCQSDFEHFPAVYAQACKQVDPKAVVTDKGFDSNTIRDQIRQDRRRVVIPSRSCRKVNLPYDKKRYRERNRIERLFNKLKNFRRIATRYEKLAKTFLACVHLALSFPCVKLIANTT